MTRPQRAVVIGGGRHARLLVQAVLAAGVPVVAVDAHREVQRLRQELTPDPETMPYQWDTGSRRRAQWKDETNKRGRSR